MSWERSRKGLVGVAIAFVLAAVHSAAALAAPAAKSKCVPASTLGSAAPGANAADMLLRATANRALWTRSAHPSVYKTLGPSSAGLLTFDRALYTASRSVGAPFLPHDPAPTSALRQPRGGADETLGLQIPAPIQWLLDKAERRQGGSEDSSGSQTREAVTTGKLLKPPGSGTGEYLVQLSEKFSGDPCPKPGGIVEGKAIYTVDREATLLPGVVNVATITVTFKAKVSKAATITSYDLTAKLTSAEGGWSGAIDGKGLTPDRIPGPKQLSGFTVSAPSEVNPATQGQLEASVRQALFRAKEDVDKWLKASQEIFKDKAKCTKVSGNNLGALRPGQTREIELDVRSIRGSRTDDGIQITGRNGLQVISPTGKATATNGKLKVQVRGTKGHSQALRADVTSYLLDVQSESELGRGVGTLELPRIGGYRFKGTLRENDFVQFGHPSGAHHGRLPSVRGSVAGSVDRSAHLRLRGRCAHVRRHLDVHAGHVFDPRRPVRQSPVLRRRLTGLRRRPAAGAFPAEGLRGQPAHAGAGDHPGRQRLSSELGLPFTSRERAAGVKDIAGHLADGEVGDRVRFQLGLRVETYFREDQAREPPFEDVDRVLAEAVPPLPELLRRQHAKDVVLLAREVDGRDRRPPEVGWRGNLLLAELVDDLTAAERLLAAQAQPRSVDIAVVDQPGRLGALRNPFEEEAALELEA